MRKTKIPYYVEYTDSKGMSHYAVNVYNTVSGYVTMMRDYVFEKA